MEGGGNYWNGSAKFLASLGTWLDSRNVLLHLFQLSFRFSSKKGCRVETLHICHS